MNIYFDMDGTIYDLYNVDNWLDKLEASVVEVFKEKALIYDMKELGNTLRGLIGKGYKIEIVTWLPKGASDNFKMEVEKAKREWIKIHMPYIRVVHCLDYGTPKQLAIDNDNISLLIDDDKKVKEMWEQENKRLHVFPNEELVDYLKTL